MVESRKREQISEKRNKRGGEGKELKERQKYAGGKLSKKRLKTSRKEIMQRTSSPHFCGVF